MARQPRSLPKKPRAALNTLCTTTPAACPLPLHSGPQAGTQPTHHHASCPLVQRRPPPSARRQPFQSFIGTAGCGGSQQLWVTLSRYTGPSHAPLPSTSYPIGTSAPGARPLPRQVSPPPPAHSSHPSRAAHTEHCGATVARGNPGACHLTSACPTYLAMHVRPPVSNTQRGDTPCRSSLRSASCTMPRYARGIAVVLPVIMNLSPKAGVAVKRKRLPTGTASQSIHTNALHWLCSNSVMRGDDLRPRWATSDNAVCSCPSRSRIRLHVFFYA